MLFPVWPFIERWTEGGEAGEEKRGEEEEMTRKLDELRDEEKETLDVFSIPL